MCLTFWLRSQKSRFSKPSGLRIYPSRPRTARPSTRPVLEWLEDRLAPAGYSLTDLGVPSGYNDFLPTAINNTGQIVGYANDSSGLGHAFLYSSGQWVNLGTLNGYTASIALGINNTGQVVGYAEAPVSGSNPKLLAEAFLYSGGQMTGLGALDSPTASASFAAGINNAGQIVGDTNEAGVSHAFLYSNGQMTDLGTSSAGDSHAIAINSAGQVVGDMTDSSGDSHAFLYSNGTITDLGTLGGKASSPAGINDSGQVVGAADTSSGGSDAFLYSNGQMTDLGIPAGYTSSGASGINSSGQIVVDADNLTSGASQAFLYSNGTSTDLNNLLPAGTTVTLGSAYAISDNGQIVAQGSDGNSYLLTPQQTTGTTISNGAVSPNTLTVSNNGQQVTVSATVSTNGSPATAGNVVFSLVGSNGTVVSDGPTGVVVGSNGLASDTLTVPGGTAAGSYSLQVAYTNNNQTATQTFTGALNITPPATAPVITANPSNQSVTVGQTATFTATASGSPTPTVQWQYSEDGGKTFSTLTGGTTTTITWPNVTMTLNGLELKAVFTNSVGSATSTVATLTVNAATAAPSILSGNGTAFTLGQGGNFLVTTSGSPLPTLTESGALPSGVTFTNNGNGTATLRGTPTAGTQGTYHFAISAQNSAGNVTQSFTLTVNPVPPIVPPLLAFFDSLLGGTETVNADGTQTITDSFFGFPLLVSTFDSHGNLVSVDLFGSIDVTFLFG